MSICRGLARHPLAPPRQPASPRSRRLMPPRRNPGMSAAAAAFRPSGGSAMKFTISARGKPNERAILPFLAKSFPAIPIIQIDSIFGFVEPSTLYGGRIFDKPELTEHDVSRLYYVGIGVR